MLLNMDTPLLSLRHMPVALLSMQVTGTGATGTGQQMPREQMPREQMPRGQMPRGQVSGIHL